MSDHTDRTASKTLPEALGMTPADEAATFARLRESFDTIRDAERKAAVAGRRIIISNKETQP